MSPIRVYDQLGAPSKLGISSESKIVAAHLDLGSVGQLTGSLPPMYGDFGRASTAGDGVGGGAATVKQGVNNRTVLGVVQQFVDTGHLVEQDAAVTERDRVTHVRLQFQIRTVTWNQNN